MQYRNLGRTGTKVSSNCLGAMTFGARTTEQLDVNLKAAELELPESIAAILEEVSRPDFGYPYSFIAQIDGRW